MTGGPIEVVLSRLPSAKRIPSGWQARCPAHGDGKPSLGLREAEDGRVLLHCRAGCPTEAVCAAIGLTMADLFPRGLEWAPPEKPLAPTFGPASAAALWKDARARALDDDAVADDAEVYDYLSARKLDESWETRSYGIVAQGMPLAEPVKRWPGAGYRLVAPLFDQRGRLWSVQARRIRNGDPKVLFPKGAQARGLVFANEAGLRLLRGELVLDQPVLFGEGLTDSLAFALATPRPVLCAPGTANAVSGIGPWVRGRDLYLVLDCDPAGDLATAQAAREAYRLGARSVNRIRWPQGSKDACDALWALGVSGFVAFLESAFVEERHAAGA